MTIRQFKTGYFVLEGLNSFATSFYFYYLFFLMQRHNGFGNVENLSLAALNGLIYALTAWLAGRFGQRFGYFKALAVGFATMALALAGGAFVHSPGGQIGVLIVWTLGICCTWPNLEALVSESEDAVGLQQMIGVYNLVWAPVHGVFQRRVPSGNIRAQDPVLASGFGSFSAARDSSLSQDPHPGGSLHRRASRPGANGDESQANRPDALFSPNGLVGQSFCLRRDQYGCSDRAEPGSHAGHEPGRGGFFCSIWFFARLGTFLVLWLWTGWHYRLRWFLGAYMLLVGSFAALLLVPKLLVVVLAQIAFGLALGLIYYSSLYYSMDVGDAKGDHGGVHEAAIGAGIFAGPAIGATAAHFLPATLTAAPWL